jgi:NitT/TauT family transport system substrate-binding protein
MVRFRSWIAGTVAFAAAALPLSAGAVDKVHAIDSTKEPYDHFALHQAIAEGYFKKRNIDVDVIWGSGGAATLQTLLTGSRDIAVGVGILSVIGAYSKGAPLVILANVFVGVGNVMWYVPANSPIKSAKDLNGKTLVYSSAGSTTSLATDFILKTTGIKAKLVAVGGMAASRTMVMSGQVDTGWLAAPTGYDLIRTGKARVVLSGADAGELNTMTARVVAANRNWFDKHRDVAKRFMEAFWAGREFNYHGGMRAVERYAKKWNIPIEDAKLAPTKFVPPSATVMRVANLPKLIKLAEEFKFVTKPMSKGKVDKLIDYVYMPPGQ